MKCKNCHACIRSRSEYICTGVPEPFVIKDVTAACTAYPNQPIKITWEPGECDWKMTDNKDGTVTFSKTITIEKLINLINKDGIKNEQ